MLFQVKTKWFFFWSIWHENGFWSKKKDFFPSKMKNDFVFSFFFLFFFPCQTSAQKKKTTQARFSINSRWRLSSCFSGWRGYLLWQPLIVGLCCGVLSWLYCLLFVLYQNVHYRRPMLAVQRHGLQRHHLMVDHVGQRSFQRLPAMVISTRLGQTRWKSKGLVYFGKPNPALTLLSSYPPTLTL